MVSGDEIGAAARDLGILHGKNIDLETEDEIGVLMDYAIHVLRREDGRNAVDRLLMENSPPEGSDQIRLLRSMQRSLYTIVQVQTPIPGVGVRGLEGPGRTPMLIVDIGFSQTAVPGMAMATRVHSPGEGWWMTTGAALPLNQQALDRIVSGSEVYRRRYGVEPAGREQTKLITRACIASGASRQIRYATPDEPDERPAATSPIRVSSKVGRNDPCPCGSGRKHKKCCGT